MKSLTIALTLSLLGVAAPFGGADGSSCHVTPPQEGLAHPTASGRYLFVPMDPNDARKLGEWSEHNGVRGLQTNDCMYMGFGMFPKDKQAIVLA